MRHTRHEFGHGNYFRVEPDAGDVVKVFGFV